MPRRQDRQHLIRMGHQVDLVERQKPGTGSGAHGVGDVDRRTRLGQEEDEVGVLERLVGIAQHGVMEVIARLHQPGGIEDHDLVLRAVEDPERAPPRGLRLGRDDREPFAQQPVHQGRLADIRRADQRDIPGAESRLAGRSRGLGRIGPRVARGRFVLFWHLHVLPSRLSIRPRVAAARQTPAHLPVRRLRAAACSILTGRSLRHDAVPRRSA